MKTVCRARLGTEKRMFGFWVAFTYLATVTAFLGAFIDAKIALAIGVGGFLVLALITSFRPSVWQDNRVILATIFFALFMLVMMLVKLAIAGNTFAIILTFVGALVLVWAIWKGYPFKLWKEIWVAAGCPEDSIKEE